MKPDCLCKNKESEKISADKMCPSLYPILLRGEDQRRILSFCSICISFICGILYFSYFFCTQNISFSISYYYFLSAEFYIFICGQNVSFSISYPLERGEHWWRILSIFFIFILFWYLLSAAKCIIFYILSSWEGRTLVENFISFLRLVIHQIINCLW